MRDHLVTVLECAFLSTGRQVSWLPLDLYGTLDPGTHVIGHAYDLDQNSEGLGR